MKNVSLLERPNTTFIEESHIKALQREDDDYTNVHNVAKMFINLQGLENYVNKAEEMLALRG